MLLRCCCCLGLMLLLQVLEPHMVRSKRQLLRRSASDLTIASLA
jgi:hypothetical protein